MKKPIITLLILLAASPFAVFARTEKELGVRLNDIIKLINALRTEFQTAAKLAAD